MTMRLDIVTNDAGELVRREHARDLGAGVVVAIYRLAKLAQVHDLGNQAFIRQLEQTHQIIGDYCLRSGSNVNVLFAHKATFVAGQLLKGNRGAYIAAQELGELFEALGGSELYIQRDLTREELNSLAEQISLFYRQGASVQFRSPTPKIRLRRVGDAARLRGIELEHMSADQRIVRAYASAVVIMRRFFEDLQNSRYILPRRIKRIAQSMVDLSDASTTAFLGVTEVRNANFDEAGRAVNSAILAVSIAREATHERTILAQIAMAAMMQDVARPRALALASGGEPGLPGMAGPSVLSEDQEDRLAAGAAAVLTALGRVNEPSITRTVLAYESLWLRRQTWLGPVYWGARAPTLHASMIAVARRYNDLLTPEPGLLPKTPDFAVATLASELRDPQDRTVLRMLVSALGLLPTGTLVQLSTGEVAEVTRGARGPFDKPRVNIVADANGSPFAQAFELELAEDPRRTVLRVLSVDGWQKGLEQAHDELQPAPDSDGPGPEDVDVGMPETNPPPPSANAVPPPALSPHGPVPMGMPPRSIADQYAEQYAAWGDANSDDGARRDSGSSIQTGSSNTGAGSGEHSSQSLPSMGSSPSAVAEAMGRMLQDPLRAAVVLPREGDRTLFQPAADGAPSRSQRDGAAPPASATDPTARGNLAATPLPHVLVYMLDHALTGSVIFEGTGGDDAIYFVHGVPAKVRLGEQVALLGELLVRSGAIDAATIEQSVAGAQRLGILLGEYLVGHDLVSREALAWALEAQLLQKIAALANLAPEITYAYYRDVDLLEGWGGEGPVTHPLNPILSSVRHWHDRARIRATLNRVGKHSLVVHPDSDLSNLAVMPEEQTVLEAIGAEPMPLAQLFKRRLTDDETVSSLVYSLAVTRQFAFKGQKKGPMAARGAAWRSVSNTPAATAGSAPPSAAPPSPAPPHSSSSVSSSGTREAPRASVAAPARPAVAVGMAPSSESRPLTPAPPPVSVRKVPAPPPRAGASPSLTQTGSLRPVAPAARPATAGRAGAPQIRPIVKKSSVSGQRAAPPAQGAAGPASTAPFPGPAQERARDPLASTPPAEGMPSSIPPDDARTIAMPVGQALKDLVGGRAPPLSRPSPVGGTAKPAPTSAFKAKAAPPMEIDFDIEGSSPDAIQIDDGGLADAEAALEAMQNFRLAEAALQRNDVAEAESLAQKAVDGDPSQHDYATLLFWLRASSGDPATTDEAIHRMSKILIEDPSNERALLYRGKLLLRTNRLHEALADFTELLSTNPHHREAANEARSLKTRIG